MKLFVTIQKNLAAMGFTPNMQQNNQLQLSPGQVFYIIKYATDLIVITLYVFREAERVGEYIDTIFSLTVQGGVFIGFVSIILKNDKLFNIIEISEAEPALSECSKVSRLFLYVISEKLMFFRIK